MMDEINIWILIWGVAFVVIGAWMFTVCGSVSGDTPESYASHKTGDPCPDCGSDVMSNGVNVWCKDCAYGISRPVLAPGAKPGD
jgi:hypothetical protein